MLMQQCELGRGTTRLITWLPRDKRVKVGTVISLNGKVERWEVRFQSIPVDPAQSPIMHGWSVGGL